MISFRVGNILESEAKVLVNTVNVVGVMGKGIALQFKNAFPQNFKVYQKACRDGVFDVGDLIVSKESSIYGEKIIVNFPTKKDWRNPSEYIYIEKGLVALRDYIVSNSIKSIAIPALGAGNGGLNWDRVKGMIVDCLEGVDSDIIIYEPNSAIVEVVKKERVKLTPARAMLLSVLYDLVRNGEFISEFSAEKVAYFLQRFGAYNEFKLDYKPKYYGPYSNKVKRVLYYLNGSYILGYDSMSAKPFQELKPIMEGEQDIIDYLSMPENDNYFKIVENTKQFFSGFYSNFTLELLSSVDYIIREKQIRDVSQVQFEISQWNERKSKMFSNQRYISIAIDHINKFSKNMVL